MSALLKFLAIVDFMSALIIATQAFSFPIIPILLMIVLFIKGILSLPADATSKIYGAIDIIAAFMILAHVTLFPLNVVIIIVLVYKGLFSLV